MKAILQRYFQHLLTLRKPLLSKQFELVKVQKPQKYNQMLYIQSLLQADPTLIQKRLSQLSAPALSQSNSKVSTWSQPSRIQLFEEQSKIIQQKLQIIRNRIYQDLFNNFCLGTTKASETPQISEKTVKKNEEESLFKPRMLNSILNCQHEIFLHPSKIQYEYQRTIQELLTSVLPHRTVTELQVKIKQQSKNLLQRGFVLQKGQPKQTLLLLYGIKKQEEFLYDLKDPLQRLLVKHHLNQKQKNHNLIHLLSKLQDRLKYYEVVIGSLNILEIREFVESLCQFTTIPNLSHFTQITSFLCLAQLLRKNKNVFNSSYYQQLLRKNSLPSKSQNPHLHYDLLFIEKWIIVVLNNFRTLVEEHLYNRGDEIKLLQSIHIYKTLKRQILKEIEESTASSALPLEIYKQQIGLSLADMNVPLEVLLSSSQTDKFNDKILEIVLFLDPNTSTDAQLTEKLKLAALLLQFFWRRQKISINFHCSQKIISDAITLIKKVNSAYQLKIQQYGVQQSYIADLLQLALANSQTLNLMSLHELFVLIWDYYCLQIPQNKIVNTQKKHYFDLIIKMAVHLSHQFTQKLAEIVTSDKFCSALKNYLIQQRTDSKKNSNELKSMLQLQFAPLFQAKAKMHRLSALKQLIQ